MFFISLKELQKPILILLGLSGSTILSDNSGLSYVLYSNYAHLGERPKRKERELLNRQLYTDTSFVHI